jgi:UDP-N-acetylmuramoyl-tripeptide--D-alanyl-D-alanine ligase
MSGKPLWTSQEVADATGGVLSGNDWRASGVTIDSRSLTEGDLFFAIQGLSRDGHEFVEMAEQSKTAAVVISRGDLVPDLKGPAVLVSDTLKAMEDLGKAARARVNAKVVAVTGSVGKTGTKEILRLALGAAGRCHVSEASYNNLWGVPLSLARMPEETEFGVFEIGMNHSGEIIPLTEMVKPDVAIVTTVAPVHLEFFKDEMEIAEAKAEIFAGLQPGGTAVLNQDNAHFDLLCERAKERGVKDIIGFGTNLGARTRLLSTESDGGGSQCRASFDGEIVEFRIGAPGRHWVLNSLAALSAARAAGADVEVAAEALAQISPPAGRGERTKVTLKDGNALTLIDESYNANPASMAAAISTLAESRPEQDGRRIVVLGDMRELGETSNALHRALGAQLIRGKIDRVYCCGPHMAALWQAIPCSLRGSYAEVSIDLIDPLVEEISANDLVMVKGSLGTNMAPIVSAIRGLNRSNATPSGRT